MALVLGLAECFRELLEAPWPTRVFETSISCRERVTHFLDIARLNRSMS